MFFARRASMALWLCFGILFLSLYSGVGFSAEPLPPTELTDWLNYALKRFPADDCPVIAPDQKLCGAVTEVELSGDLKSGEITAVFSGYNFSRVKQTMALIGPAKTFAIIDASVELSENSDPDEANSLFVAPFFDEHSADWKITVPPGHFEVTATLLFTPEAVVSLNLPEDVGRVHDNDLTGGTLQFDATRGNHGGSVQFFLEGSRATLAEKPLTRVVRVIHWGAVPTFEYFVTVEGIHTETLVEIPLLADENIERLTPDRSYQLVQHDGTRFVQVSLSASLDNLNISGHYQTTPTSLVMGNALPFEVWVHVADRRYPVNMSSTADPIDPSEFSDVVATINARAFLMHAGEKLDFNQVNLNVDEGREGTGSLNYKLYEGVDGFWLEKLFLTAKVPGLDRLVIPTPKPPVYAGIGDEGIELFHDDNNQLSVRLPKAYDDVSIEVDWQQNRQKTNFAAVQKMTLPAQNVYLEDQNVEIFYRPGVVPLFTWGAYTTSGDLLDQFHLYGFLVGLLAFFICRGLKFNTLLSALVTLLFVGLYLEERFPTSLTLIMMIATLVVSLLTVEKLKLKRLMQLVWVILFAATAAKLGAYGHDRVYNAIHPYAQAAQVRAYSYNDNDDFSGEMMMKPKAAPLAGASNVMPEEMLKQDISYSANAVNATSQRLYKVSDWNSRPVKQNVYDRGGNNLKLTWHNVASLSERHFGVVVVGPILRGLWMLAEVGIVFALMLCLGVKAKRLFYV